MSLDTGNDSSALEMYQCSGRGLTLLSMGAKVDMVQYFTGIFQTKSS